MSFRGNCEEEEDEEEEKDGKIVWLRLEPPQIDDWCLLLTLSTVFRLLNVLYSFFIYLP